MKAKKRTELSVLLDLTHYLFGLKQILRFKGMSGWEGVELERWDSVSEHSHRMALLAIMLHKHLEQENRTDLLKVLKMVLIHDVVELIANDYSPVGVAKDKTGGGHALNPQAFRDKYDKEIAAANRIFGRLSGELGKEFISLFTEYINTKAKPKSATKEGKFAYALDKIEAVVQIIDWRGITKDWPRKHFEKSMEYLYEWCSYDRGLLSFYDLLRKEGKELVVGN